MKIERRLVQIWREKRVSKVLERYGGGEIFFKVFVEDVNKIYFYFQGIENYLINGSSGVK